MSTIPIDQWKTIPSPDKLRLSHPRDRQFCLDQVPITFDASFPYSNHHWTGKPNPKTLERNAVIAPPASWDYWSASSSVPSAINRASLFDNQRAGYVDTPKKSSSCNVSTSFPAIPKNTGNGMVFPTPTEHSIPPEVVFPTPSEETPVLPPYISTTTENGMVFPTPKVTENTVSNTVSNTETNIGKVVENYPLQGKQTDEMYWVNEKGSRGDMLGQVYNPQQLVKHGIPSNVPTGTRHLRPELDEYHQRMYTNVIQPGLYNRVEVVEPIHSNLGISFQQQLQPIRREETREGVAYTTADPRLIKPTLPEPKCPPTPNVENVYDPRHTGYGTNYRHYIDPMTGQPRFMYDDVDAIRKPNYIVRSNIDHAPHAHQYGSVEPEKDELKRDQVHQQFLGDTLQQREELQQRYMRKYNAQVAWQRRQAPIHTRNTA